MTIFISSLVVDCVNVNVCAYVLQVGKSIVALLPCSIHFQCVMKQADLSAKKTLR